MQIKVKLTRTENADYYGAQVGDTVEVPLETYVAGVVASEMGNPPIEAAKAQAIAARTFAYPFYSKGKAITDASSQHQAFRIQRVANGKYPNAVLGAQKTAGMVLEYNGQVISTCSYSASNGGRTTSAEKRWGSKRAWLIEQEDPWDAAAGSGKNGHGVGMSQRGCRYAANIGKTCEEILSFYYIGTTIRAEQNTNDEESEVEGMIGWKTFVDKCMVALNEKWGYIWGESGSVWTEEKQRRATRDMTKKYGSKWIGRRVTDCSGLPYWAMKQLGGKLYHGANTIYNLWCTSKGKLADKTDLKWGSVVFLYDPKQSKPRHHIGVFVGNDTVVEAKGTQAGVVTSRLSHWDEWGELKGIDYSDAPLEHIEADKPTLRNGAKGAAVKSLQTLLGNFGYALTIDGIFGSGTEAAVRNFQTAHGLTADGVCGAQTWAALNVGETNHEDMPTERDEDSEKPVEEREELLERMEMLYAQWGACIAEIKKNWS